MRVKIIPETVQYYTSQMTINVTYVYSSISTGVLSNAASKAMSTSMRAARSRDAVLLMRGISISIEMVIGCYASTHWIAA